MNNFIEFAYSPWLVLVCLLLGATYAYLQYTKESPWSLKINLVLGVVRGLLITLIAILILGPMVRAVINYYEPPVLVITVDTSESIALALDSLEQRSLIKTLKEVEESMLENDWQVTTVNLTGSEISPDSLNFSAPRTDLTRMLRQQLDKYAGANLGGLLVVSDGIFNAGFSPDLVTPFTPIYTLGLGDTIPRRDASIIMLEYSKTVYQDNRYPMHVRIRNEGLQAVDGRLSIYDNGVLVTGEKLEFNNDNRLIEQEFLLDATVPGKHRISVVLDSIPGEATIVNNRQQVYIDVIDGKQRILLAAEAPSPDVKAFKAALGQNSRYEIDQVFGAPPQSEDYDLIVLFNSPTRISSRVYNAVAKADVPKLYFLGSSTNMTPYIQSGLVGFARRTTQVDQVRAAINPELNAFNLVNDFDIWLTGVPPMTVPFGDMILPPNSQIVLNQKIGSVVTNRPIIYLADTDPKAGVILGDGLWTWRLDEYRNYSETIRFDELLSKITQYLAAKPDNRQFKLYPAKNGFEIGEEMMFIAETYNQLFEPVYGEPVTLNIYNDSTSWNYSFTPLSGTNKFNLDYLPEGLYSYTGTTFLEGKKHTAAGQFSVEKPNVEAADLTADYRVLRNLANESGGQFFSNDELDALKQEMASLEATSVIHSQDKETFLINLSWVLILLLLLASLEWLTRKMMGGY